MKPLPSAPLTFEDAAIWGWDFGRAFYTSQWRRFYHLSIAADRRDADLMLHLLQEWPAVHHPSWEHYYPGVWNVSRAFMGLSTAEILVDATDINT